MVFASMRAVRLFLRARVINFLMQAASTLEITNGEQRALCKFSTSWILFLLNVVLRQVIWLTFSKQDAKLGNMIRPYLSSTIPSIEVYSQFCLV